MKSIAILGSTGSIGTQTLEVVRQNNDICVSSLAAGKNIALLEKQVREFLPALVAVADEEAAKTLAIKVADLDVKVLSGEEGMIEVAVDPKAEILVTAIVGMRGLRPTVAAICAGKDIALANKETLVTAGHFIMPLAREKNSCILPVDSEHSAIFQSLQGNTQNQIEKILLTASGGPFRGKSKKELERVTLENALKHPNWAMGQKITIDSATLVNKGLEMIEAKWLFDLSLDQIEVVVHPQSVIHSAVQYNDGAVIAQLGTPDMKLPIQYALYYPERKFLSGERLDLFSLQTISFERADEETFQGLKLAKKALVEGGSMPTVFNAANEEAVKRFLNQEIHFLDIPEIIDMAMQEAPFMDNPSVDEIMMLQQQVEELIESRW